MSTISKQICQHSQASFSWKLIVTEVRLQVRLYDPETGVVSLKKNLLSLRPVTPHSQLFCGFYVHSTCNCYHLYLFDLLEWQH